MWDDEAGYSYDDPCHPSYHDRYSFAADLLKKRLRESPVVLTDVDPGDEDDYQDAA